MEGTENIDIGEQIDDLVRQIRASDAARALKDAGQHLRKLSSLTLVTALPPEAQRAIGQLAEYQANQLLRINQTWLAQLQDSLRKLDEAASAAQTAMLHANVVAGLSATLAPSVEALRGLFQQLPKLAELRRLYQEGRSGAATLEECGLGFVDQLWTFAFVASFAHVPERTRHLAVTNRLLTLTRGVEFEEQLRRRFLGSQAVRRRWPIVLAALRAHRQRQYTLSIPALLSQIEGAVADAAILQNEAVRRGDKLYRRQASGAIQVSRDGKPVEIRGLRALMQHSRWNDHPLLRDLAAHIATQLAPDRNGILHGGRTDFARAKESVRYLLVLWGLSSLIIELETGALPDD